MKKRIISLVLMISMVVMLLPTTVFANANVIERTLDIVYNGPSKICVEQDFTFSYTIPDNYRSGFSFLYIRFDGGMIDFHSAIVSSNGQTYTATVTSEQLKRKVGNSSSCVVYMGADHNSGWEYGTGYIKVAIEIGHIDVNKDHICDVETCKATVGTCEDADKDHKCDYGCGKTFGVCSGGAATCKDKAVCDYCGKPYGELNGSTHAGGTHIKNDKAATCNEDGYTGDTYCKGCETKLQDGKPVTKLGHIDADKNHVCDREECKATVGTCEDADKNHKCDYGCGKTFGVCSGGTATCKDKAVCDYCGKPYGELDSSNHAGGTEVRNAKDATCTEDGYTGDTYCKGCETKLSSGKSVDKTGHDYESKVTKEATTTSTGTKTYTCKNCGHSYEEEIAKLPSSSHDGESAESDEPLAQTSDSAPIAAAAVLMLAGGAAALAARRRCA